MLSTGALGISGVFRAIWKLRLLWRRADRRPRCKAGPKSRCGKRAVGARGQSHKVLQRRISGVSRSIHFYETPTTRPTWCGFGKWASSAGVGESHWARQLMVIIGKISHFERHHIEHWNCVVDSAPCDRLMCNRHDSR